MSRIRNHPSGEALHNIYLQAAGFETDYAVPPYKNYTAAELAASLNVSASYFQHLYKEIFEISFKADLINMRLDYAQTLITNTYQTLEKIALASGYTNEIHFYRQFKVKTGMTPREYAAAMQPITVSSPDS